MKRKKLLLQRCVQALSLFLFLFFLFQAAYPLGEIQDVDGFFHLDPLIAGLVPLAEGTWLSAFGEVFFLLLIALVLGRVFCGFVCPMGATLDFSHFLSKFGQSKKKRKTKAKAETFTLPAKTKYGKYLFLAALLGCALIGVNAVFLGSPLSLITRFYGLFVYPLFLWIGQGVLSLLQMVDWGIFAYASLPQMRFRTVFAIVVFFALLFVLEKYKPRFWCRYVCPAGALLALFSVKPLVRRRVVRCTQCGTCAKICPMGCIAGNGSLASHRECINCGNCADVCPVKGLVFLPKKNTKEVVYDAPPIGQQKGQHKGEVAVLPALPSRRAFLGATACGVLAGSTSLLSLSSVQLGKKEGELWNAGLVRPPAAVAEPDFLRLCVRCGLCMKACPRNALQPAWLEAGLAGMLSPVFVARRGPCEPDCHVCGQVCPTEAIASLPLEEKKWAKIGTAVVQKSRCIAWEQGKSCVVCQEVCPYGAVRLVQNPEKPSLSSAPPVPVVNVSRCYGCGYCEYHCPVRLPAILVEPLQAMRLPVGQSAYEENARAQGLTISLAGEGETAIEEVEIQEGGLPPGFSLE